MEINYNKFLEHYPIELRFGGEVVCISLTDAKKLQTELTRILNEVENKQIDMEFLNKVELKGVVGRVSTTKEADKSITNFSLMTEQVNVNKDGLQTTEVTWFNCTTFNEIDISVGDYAHCLGRLRIRRYTAEDGAERVIYEVLVDSVTILEK